MKLKFNFRPIRKYLDRVFDFITVHWVVAITIAGGLIALLVINGVQAAITVKSDQTIYASELSTFTNIVFDEEVIEQIVKLTANEVDIQADLPENRDNPFLDF